MSVPKDIISSNPELLRSILSGYRGSIAHGMYIPNKDPLSVDDKDVMYVVVPEIDYYFGYPPGWGSNKVFPVKGTKEIKKNEWDIVVYEARRFIELLARGNPNVLMMLWLEPNHYINITNSGQMILDNKNLFVGKHAYHSFTGYAYGQLHRMTHNAFQGHMGDKRRTLVEKFGFDTKNAAHLVRLLRMGIEFLNEGILHVQREDASELLEIKKGEWSLDRITKEADRLFKLSEETYLSSKLPNKPDYEAINELSIDVIKTALEI